MVKNVDQHSLKHKMTSSNFPQPEDIQFTVIENKISYKIFPLELEWDNFVLNFSNRF